MFPPDLLYPHYNMPTDVPASRVDLPVPMRKTPSGGVTLNAKGALLHRQLYVLLKEQIMSGHYQSGDLLPTQEALCLLYSTAVVRGAAVSAQAVAGAAHASAPPARSDGPAGFLRVEVGRFACAAVLRVLGVSFALPRF